MLARMDEEESFSWYDADLEINVGGIFKTYQEIQCGGEFISSWPMGSTNSKGSFKLNKVGKVFKNLWSSIVYISPIVRDGLLGEKKALFLLILV